ncbi:MAG: DnaB-like helicase C-terminal domain-containing protein [Alphaproteobacteria bacterium]
MSDPGWTPSGDSSLLPEPPSLPEAEVGLLGCILTNGAWAHNLADRVEPHHFSEAAYGALWEVVLQLVARDAPITLPTLMEPAAAHLGWEKADTGAFLVALLKRAVSPSAKQARYYADMIRDVWIRRQVFVAADEMKVAARKGAMGSSGAQVLEEVESKLFTIGAMAASDERTYEFSQAISAALDQAHVASEQREAGKLIGVTCGVDAVDKKLGGLRKTDVVVLAGATGMGKTAAALKITTSAAKQFLAENPDKPQWVHFFSMEMSADQLASRAVAGQARISSEKIRLGNSSPTDLMALAKAGAEIEGLPIQIDDSSNLSVSAIRTRARRLKRKKGLGLIVIDYLQLIGNSAEERKETRGNRVQELGLIMRGLKALAKDMDVPVLVLCQLSRKLEEREDKRPQLSDLRESGEIEMTADVVSFVYREAYYLGRRPPARREKEKELEFSLRRAEWASALEQAKDRIEFIIGKNRHGSCATLVARFVPELMLLEDDTPGDATQTDARKEQLRMNLMAVD